MRNLIDIKKGRMVATIIINPLIVFFMVKGILFFLGLSHSNLSIIIFPLMMVSCSIGVFMGVFVSNKKFKELNK